MIYTLQPILTMAHMLWAAAHAFLPALLAVDEGTTESGVGRLRTA